MALDAASLLRKHGLRAKKSWGQNFLVDERAFSEIVRAAEVGAGDWVVEIGAGLGTLTDRLAATGARVVAVERERQMVEVLRAELGTHPGVEIAEANALTFDVAAVAARAGRKVVVVGNLPYQIASPILFHVFEARAQVTRLVVMLQREMAERIVAAPGTAEYGALSVMVRLQGPARIVCRVPPGAFRPAPRVASAVLRIDVEAGPRVEGEAARRASKVVHAAFGQRRKTLRNALKAIAPEAAVDAALAAAAIDGQRRGETLDVDEFLRLSAALV